MIVTETPLAGVLLIEPELRHDDRGFFARTFCRSELRKRGIEFEVVQCNISHNERRGTLRGLHYQRAPYGEPKLVSVTRGAIYDVVVDVRAESPTWGEWYAVELSAENRRGLSIPEGMAHGFQTLADDTDVFYQMGREYAPSHAAGYRYDDPAFGIAWPLPVQCISDRDLSFQPAAAMRV